MIVSSTNHKVISLNLIASTTSHYKEYCTFCLDDKGSFRFILWCIFKKVILWHGRMSAYLIFLIGISATMFSLWSTVPQIRKSLRTRKTDDVSKWLIISLITGLSLWVLYGILKGDIVITIANAIGVTLNIILLALKLRYCHKWIKQKRNKWKQNVLANKRAACKISGDP